MYFVAKVQVNHAIMIRSIIRARISDAQLHFTLCILLHSISLQVLLIHVTKLIRGYMGFIIASYGQEQGHSKQANSGSTLANFDSKQL